MRHTHLCYNSGGISASGESLSGTEDDEVFEWGTFREAPKGEKNASRKPVAALKLKNIASATCQTARDFGMPLKFEYISHFCDLCDTGQRNCLSQLLLYLE